MIMTMHMVLMARRVNPHKLIQADTRVSRLIYPGDCGCEEKSADKAFTFLRLLKSFCWIGDLRTAFKLEAFRSTWNSNGLAIY